MDKEWTLFVVDESPLVKNLDKAIEYIKGILLSKVVRGKKNDQVSIITCHDELIQVKPKRGRIYTSFSMPSYQLMQDLDSTLHVNHEPLEYDEKGLIEDGSLSETLLLAFEELVRATKSGAKKTSAKASVGKCNMIVFTNHTANNELEISLIEGLSVLAVDLNCRLTIIDLDPKGKKYDETIANLKEKNLFKWNELILKIKSKSNDKPSQSATINIDNALDLLKDWKKGIPKIYKPTRTFNGELRLCCDLDSVDLENASFSNDREYNRHTDPISLVINVEGYPLIKEEKKPSAKHMGYASDDEPKSVKLLRDRIVKQRITPADEEIDTKKEDDREEKEDTDDSEIKYEEIPVDNESLMKTYRYGTSLIPLTSTFNELLKYPTYSGIDIRGFVKKDRLPSFFFMGEPTLLIGGEATRDRVAFAAMCQSLLDVDSVGIIRYTLRSSSGVFMGALIPFLVNAHITLDKGPVGLKREFDETKNQNVYGMALHMLPFKEDQKLPFLFDLTGVKENDDYLPSEAMLDQMDEFVDLMNIDDPKKERPAIACFETHDFDSNLPLPLPNVQSKLDNTWSKILHSRSPSIHIFNKILRDIVNEFNIKNQEEGESLGKAILNDSEKVDKVIKSSFDQLVESKDKLVVELKQIDEERYNKISKSLATVLDNKLITEEAKSDGKKRVTDEMFVKDEGDLEEIDIDALLMY
ncbi:hypothetical protein LJB42_003469 [Komagataella kurtzmanii]|nr:hypothetical protein LJB42_003469 [Komagataella kurtzmanii]